MKKKNFNADSENNSNTICEVISEETTAKVANRVKTKCNLSEVTDEIENETPKKSKLFDEVKKLFGFATFDKESFLLNAASDLASGVITPAKFFELQKQAQNEVSENNKTSENLSFEKVCETICESGLNKDLLPYLGTSDLLALKPLLIDGANVVLYHGAQSEGGKFHEMSIFENGLRKKYLSKVWYSKDEANTSNILRALRYYSYYVSAKRSAKNKSKDETKKVNLLKEILLSLHKECGYMKEDFVNIVNEIDF